MNSALVPLRSALRAGKCLACFLWAGVCLCALFGSARAGDAAGAPVAAASAPEDLTGNWGGARDELGRRGVTLTPSWIGEVFGNPSGGSRRGAISDGLFNLPLDLDFDPLTEGAVRDLTFHVNALYLYGAGLSSGFVGDFSNTSSIAGYNSVRLDELWVEKGFWDRRLTLRAGNLAVDTEFFWSDSAALFINGTFGAFTLLANNLPDFPAFPLASPGLRVRFAPDPHGYVMAGVYGLDDGSFPNLNNPNGTRFSLDGRSGVLVMAEAGFLLNQAPGDRGLPGSYRLGAFVDTGDFATWASQADFAQGTGPWRGAGADFGLYGVVDQQIVAWGTRRVTLFARFGGSPADVNFVDYYIEGGFNCTGFVPGRDRDVAGVAVARSHISSDYSAAQTVQGGRPFSAETVLEATYRARLAPGWTLQPDLQYIVTPGGEAGARNALVLGLRTTVAF